MSEEVRDNMRIVWDAPIEMSDGVVLRADVFRPIGESTIPAILSYGPYAKGMSFAESRPFAWQRLIKTHPVAMATTSNKYQAWELPDPEDWGRMAMPLCVSMRAGPAARRAIWIPGRRARPKISTNA